MPGAIMIREADPDEYDRVGDVVHRAYRAFYGGDLGDYGERLRDVAVRAAAATVLVALLDGHIAGSVTYVADARSPYAELLTDSEAGIRMLATAPEWQGRGIGRALSLACIDRARAAGRSAVVLHADEVMLGAQRLYESLGFRRDPQRDFRPDEQTQLRCYVLRLGEAT